MVLSKIKNNLFFSIKSEEKSKADSLSKIKYMKSKGKLQAGRGVVSLMKKARRVLPRFLPRHGKMHVRNSGKV